MTAAVLFNDHHRQGLHHLKGGEALVAGQAFPAAADAAPLVGGPGVHHLALQMGTVWAFHYSIHPLS